MNTRQNRSRKKSGQCKSSTCRSVGKCRDNGGRRQRPCVRNSHQRFLHRETLMQLLEELRFVEKTKKRRERDVNVMHLGTTNEKQARWRLKAIAGLVGPQGG